MTPVAKKYQENYQFHWTLCQGRGVEIIFKVDGPGHLVQG